MRRAILERAGNGLLFLLAGAAACDDAAPDAMNGSAPPSTDGASGATGAHPDGASTGTADGSAAGNGAGAGIGGSSSTTANDVLWCKAKAALEARCVPCHDGHGTAGTPMGLATHADLVAPAPGWAAKQVWERVAVRIHADRAMAEGLGPMPPKNDMSAEQIADLDAWIAASAPGSDAVACAASPVPGTNGRPISIWDPTLCDAIYTLTAHDGAGGKVKVPASPQESYPKIDFDAPWGDEIVQIINQRPITDNGAVLHHWILYDKAGPFITGWAPGDEERRPLPEDVGLKVPSGRSSMYLDMHYYNRTGVEQEDASGVELCVVKGENLRPNPAGITMGFSQLAFSIPRGATNYRVRGECTIRASQPIHLMSASPHAHRLARHMVFSVQKKDGTMINMLDAPFAFGEQASYPLSEDVVLESGDKVITECMMTNDTNRAVTFGESNDSEMCFNFATYYPVGAFCCEELGLQSCLFGGTGAGGLLGGD